MGLQIERKLGEDFYVRDERFQLTEIHNAKSCTIVRSQDGMCFHLTYEGKQEIARNVLAFVGDRGQLGLIRIAFDADRSIPIVRGESYALKGGAN